MTAPSVPRVAVLGAVRTPIGKYGGALRGVPAVALGTLAVRSALDRARVPASEVPELFFGHCIQAGAGQNPARQVLRGAGIPDTAGAVTINMVCGSGMQSVISASQAIRAGDFDLVVAGGMESMSSAPYLVPSGARWGLRYGSSMLEDAMLRDALLDAYGEHEHMGLTGERIARDLGLTRADVDAFALGSHLKAADASAKGVFDDEIVEVPPQLVPGHAGLRRDEGPRGDTTLAGLARLRPSFRPDGVLTAGSASQLSDGAAALVLASEAEVERRGLTPWAWIHSSMVSGVPPERVMESPIPTVKKHLEKTGLRPTEFDRVEHNEAFASASIAVQRAFGFTDAQFNVHGGAVALGHPIGASGARILVTLLQELRRSRTHLGLATLCMGGGNGLSLILDRRGL
ncbi:MAG: acetyl-CoA C-acyltransferase [Thermoplasmata archaeon]|nr:acetyl-CoA C-acyltransferase [Thermoplasmata archaeon]MCI4355439.1 acetyl-CoA C-acyltransferase [Thermoplasmata archaeon]